MKNKTWIFPIVIIALFGALRSTFYKYSRSASASGENELVLKIDAHSGYSEYFDYDNTCECFMSNKTKGKLDFIFSFHGHTETYSSEDLEEEEHWYSIEESSEGYVTLVDETFEPYEMKVIEGSYEDWLYSGERLVLQDTRDGLYDLCERLLDEMLVMTFGQTDCREGRMQLDAGEGLTIIDGNQLTSTAKGVTTIRCDLNPNCTDGLSFE